MSSVYQREFPVFSKSSAHKEQRSAFYAALHPDLSGSAGALSEQQKTRLFREILENKIHGIAFSPYLEGQKPRIEITEQQIEQRMRIIAPYTRWIRSFSCLEGHQHTPVVARRLGLKTMVGVSIGDEPERNEEEFSAGIELARAGVVDILAIGNEVLLRGDLEEDALLDYIARAKQQVPDVPVSYVDAYFLFEKHPRVTEACDVLLINCYPFWESCPAEFALLHMKEMYRRTQQVANGKQVIISETGWPNIGSAYGAAEPGHDNALNYFIDTYQWAAQEGIDVFYFSSFDETWKKGDEGDVGACWGLWDQHGNLKYV